MAPVLFTARWTLSYVLDSIFEGQPCLSPTKSSRIRTCAFVTERLKFCLLSSNTRPLRPASGLDTFRRETLGGSSDSERNLHIRTSRSTRVEPIGEVNHRWRQLAPEVFTVAYR
jgi:hypothetical protein